MVGTTTFQLNGRPCFNCGLAKLEYSASDTDVLLESFDVRLLHVMLGGPHVSRTAKDASVCGRMCPENFS